MEALIFVFVVVLFAKAATTSEFKEYLENLDE
jgi:hypothetical protein